MGQQEFKRERQAEERGSENKTAKDAEMNVTHAEERHLHHHAGDAHETLLDAKERRSSSMGSLHAPDQEAQVAHAHEPKRPEPVIFGYKVKGQRWFQLLVCACGVGVFGVVHDFVQEGIFRYDEWDYGWYMTLCELLIFVLTARVELQLNGSTADLSFKGVPWKEYIYLTIVLAITQGAGTVALTYVNFPVKVVMKSSKLIPTMAMGILIIRRRYSTLEYTAAFMLCTGVALFALVDSRVQPKFDHIGILLLTAAVCGDAMTVNLQEKILTQLKCSKEQMILVSNLMAAGWVFVICIATGELWKAFFLSIKYPPIFFMLLLQSLSQYLGVSFYLALIQGFGGVVAVCVTSCRKVVTIVLSFMAFSKPFSVIYVPTGLLVLSGIWLSAAAKAKGSENMHTNLGLAAGALSLIASIGGFYYL